MARRQDVKRRSSALGIGAMSAVALTLVFADYRTKTAEPADVRPAPVPVAAAAVVPVAPPVVGAEMVATPAEVVEPETPAGTPIDRESRTRLAAELERWVTRDADKLVDVIADLAESQALPLPPAYLLSIAWSETRGKILAVSPAGAVGLAQAMPSAYLSEGFDGKVFMTNPYLIGMRAFIMKKPLGDAMAISDSLIRKNTPARRTEARALLARAMELRQEGMDELEALRPVANDVFFEKIAEADAHNLATLRELERLIERGAPRAETKRFHDRVEKDYRFLRNQQRNGWKRYEDALTAERDRMLRARFGQPADVVIRTRPYEAGEYLGEHLDARFSPKHMAHFMAVHLATKQRQALELGVPEETLEAWTAALYNGGTVNVKRMQAGLIDTLRETERYMQSVSSRSARLARAIG